VRRLLLLVAFLAVSSEAFAQGAALSTDLDISVRAAGMGRCSNAVFWGGDADAWSNPALLGYHSGIRFTHGRTQLVPDLADDVHFTTNQVSLAAYGLGFTFSGKPFDGFGSVRLDYGTSQITSPTGEDLGSFDSYEDIRSWGVGLSVGRAADALLRATGHASPRLLRHADVALGMNKKDVDVMLFPELPGLPSSGIGSTSAEDRGVFFRLSPYNSFDGPGFVDGIDRALQLALDAGYGISTLNRGQPEITFGDFEDRLMEENHKGWSAHVALQPQALNREFQDSHLAWLGRSLSPAVSFGATWERNTLKYEGYDYLSGSTFPAESRITNRGWELTLLNVFSVRRGHVADPDGNVRGTTDGWGVGYTFDGIAGVRYDKAKVPQATDPETGQRLADVHRRGWTVFFDPLRAWGRRM
jgi:hypothetical protein